MQISDLKAGDTIKLTLNNDEGYPIEFSIGKVSEIRGEEILLEVEGEIFSRRYYFDQLEDFEIEKVE